MRCSSRLTSGFRSTARTRLMIATFTPMPSASVITTVADRPRAFSSERIATFNSRPSIAGLLAPVDDLQEATLALVDCQQEGSFGRAFRTTPAAAGAVGVRR